jgi:hypothetical protein
MEVVSEGQLGHPEQKKTNGRKRDLNEMGLTDDKDKDDTGYESL